MKYSLENIKMNNGLKKNIINYLHKSLNQKDNNKQ